MSNLKDLLASFWVRFLSQVIHSKEFYWLRLPVLAPFFGADPFGRARSVVFGDGSLRTRLPGWHGRLARGRSVVLRDGSLRALNALVP